MPVFRSRRTADEADVRIARARVASLRTASDAPSTGRRGGWVPRVPASIGIVDEPVRDGSPFADDPHLDAALERFWNPAGDDARGSDSAPGRHRVRAAVPPSDADHRVPDGDAGRDAVARFGLGRAHLIVVAVSLAVGLIVTLIMGLLSRPESELATTPARADVVATGTPMPGTSDGPDPADGDPAGGTQHGGEVVVHVAGLVAEPGVVTLPAGSRVVDAIAAAGGAEPDVDLAPLNLARVLADGEQVVVGIEVPAGPETGNGDGGASDTAVIDLNAASASDLESLPGIGPTLAQRILDWRTENGRFSTVDELREVTGIGDSRFADLEPLVTV